MDMTKHFAKFSGLNVSDRQCAYCGGGNDVCEDCGYCDDHHYMGMIGKLEENEEMAEMLFKLYSEIASTKGANVPVQNFVVVWMWHNLSKKGFTRKQIEDVLDEFNSISDILSGDNNK